MTRNHRVYFGNVYSVLRFKIVSEKAISVPECGMVSIYLPIKTHISKINSNLTSSPLSDLQVSQFVPTFLCVHYSFWIN